MPTTQASLYPQPKKALQRGHVQAPCFWLFVLILWRALQETLAEGSDECNRHTCRAVSSTHDWHAYHRRRQASKCTAPSSICQSRLNFNSQWLAKTSFLTKKSCLLPHVRLLPSDTLGGKTVLHPFSPTWKILTVFFQSPLQQPPPHDTLDKFSVHKTKRPIRHGSLDTCKRH